MIFRNVFVENEKKNEKKKKLKKLKKLIDCFEKYIWWFSWLRFCGIKFCLVLFLFISCLEYFYVE